MLNARTIHVAALGLAIVALAGCSTFKNSASDARTIAEEHPISVDSQTVTLTLTRSADGELSPLDAARVRAFAEAYMNKGHGPISVTTPEGADAGAPDAFAARIEDALYDAGVARGASMRSGYAKSSGSDRSYILSYTHYVATPSACGVWEGIRERDYKNMRHPNFGCASQNNLAAMVVDPRDLVAPADMVGPDSAIRIRGVRAFRAGEDTSSERNSEIEAQVSE